MTDHLTSFFPLASTLANRSLRLLGVLLIGVATAALATGLASATAPSTVTGAGAGLCLLAFGAGPSGWHGDWRGRNRRAQRNRDRHDGHGSRRAAPRHIVR